MPRCVVRPSLLLWFLARTFARAGQNDEDEDLSFMDTWDQVSVDALPPSEHDIFRLDDGDDPHAVNPFEHEVDFESALEEGALEEESNEDYEDCHVQDDLSAGWASEFLEVHSAIEEGRENELVVHVDDYGAEDEDEEEQENNEEGSTITEEADAADATIESADEAQLHQVDQAAANDDEDFPVDHTEEDIVEAIKHLGTI